MVAFYYKPGDPVRFGNGIEIYVGCKDFTVTSNYIYQIYDAEQHISSRERRFALCP